MSLLGVSRACGSALKQRSAVTLRSVSATAARTVPRRASALSPAVRSSFLIAPLALPGAFSTALSAPGPATDAMDASVDLTSYDSTQVELLDERVIMVNEKDEVLGSGTKKDSHLMTTIRDGQLHRAFSVFLIDSQNRLLLQKRASEKIMFPNRWTNTCCSHPLHFEEEMEEKGQLGVRRAARRKLEHELGIPQKSLSLDDFTFLTRIYYQAQSDETWGEHEVDYILFLKKDLEYTGNPNEVSECKYVTQDELRAMLAAPDADAVLSPWFKKIADQSSLLWKWWDSVDNLSEFQDNNIHHL